MKAFGNRSMRVESFLIFILLVSYACQALAAEATLAWDANSEPDIAGYGVYYQKGFLGPPFEFFGYVSLQELTDPNNPSSAVTGLENDADYYFAVTAFDSEGYESSFSNSVCAHIGDTISACAADSNGSGGGSGGSSGGGGGGGGGGCFINASAGGSNGAVAWAFGLFVLTWLLIRSCKSGFEIIVMKKNSRFFRMPS